MYLVTEINIIQVHRNREYSEQVNSIYKWDPTRPCGSRNANFHVGFGDLQEIHFISRLQRSNHMTKTDVLEDELYDTVPY